MESGYWGEGQSLGLREGCPPHSLSPSANIFWKTAGHQPMSRGGLEPSLYCSPPNLHSVNLSWRDWLGIFRKLELGAFFQFSGSWVGGKLGVGILI